MRSDLLRQAIQSLLKLLDTLDQWIDEIPPLQSPQRFGNLAFRTWGNRLEEVSVEIMSYPDFDSSPKESRSSLGNTPGQ